ncbi:MAG: hypothetical protein PHF84_11345, partial [bacterium]|nr:hypothetical protein [bacterium]
MKSVFYNYLLYGLSAILFLFSGNLNGEITSWDSFGGLNWSISFNQNYHGPSLSVKADGPKSSLTYGFIYQIIQIDPHKQYCLNLWVSNITMRTAGGRIGFREDYDFDDSSFKAATDFLPADGDKDEDYGEKYV